MHISRLSNIDKNRGCWTGKFVKYLIELLKIRPLDFKTVDASRNNASNS